MKIAIVGSRSIIIDNLGDYLPKNVTQIISGGAIGVDRCARRYAISNNIELVEFLPEYEKYGRYAPIKRNDTIVDSADLVLAFYDGVSRGTRYTIEYARRCGKAVRVILCNKEG